MTTKTLYKMFQCENCMALDCLKVFAGDYIHTQDETFNPVMNCWSCKGKDTMIFNKEITSDEHEQLFRGGKPPSEMTT